MDETYEQFEERVLNKRAAHMYHVIKSKLDTKDKLTLSEMAFKNNRKQVSNLKNNTRNAMLTFVKFYFEDKTSISFYSIFVGCAEILYTTSFEEISSTRTLPRIFVC